MTCKPSRVSKIARKGAIAVVVLIVIAILIGQRIMRILIQEAVRRALHIRI